MAKFSDLTAATAHNKDTTLTPSRDLSQLKPSEGFVKVFGEKPFRPAPGQSLRDMRGQKMAYQQLIRDWDEVEVAEAPLATQMLLDSFAYGIGLGITFTSSQRPGLHCRFPGIPSRPYDIDNLSDWGGVRQAIINAQARYIEHVGSLPSDKLYPHSALAALNNSKMEEEAAEEV